jgi:glycosyltransferase involved in cell wall biosynthesis
MLGALRARLPYILTFHGGGHSSRLRNRVRSIQWRALRPLVRRAERLIALAKFEVELYSRTFGLTSDAFSVIPNGSDFPESAASESAESDPNLVVSIGRLEKYKGHHRIIAALPALLSVRPDARLLILGSGPYESQLRQLANELSVADRVEIRGISPTDRTAMARAIASAAIVVLMSEYETHPLAALEALALGRPVLVAATSGLAEVAKAWNARTIALGCTTEELAAAIADQLDHPSIPRRATLPTWDDCARKLEALYVDILRARQWEAAGS